MSKLNQVISAGGVEAAETTLKLRRVTQVWPLGSSELQYNVNGKWLNWLEVHEAGLGDLLTTADKQHLKSHLARLALVETAGLELLAGVVIW